MPKPGTNEYEGMVDFMRADLESGMGYSKLIAVAKKLSEDNGEDFNENYKKWKEKNKNK